MKLWLFRLSGGALGFFIAICLALASTDTPGLLIIGHDAEHDSLSRQDSGFRNVAEAVAGDMLARGFRIYDDSALRIEGTFEENQGWTDGGTIGASFGNDLRLVHYALVVSVFSDVRYLAYATTVHPRIRGRLLAVPSGELLGTLDARLPGPIYAASDCRRACLSRIVSDQSGVLAASFGAAFAEKFNALEGGFTGVGAIAGGALGHGEPQAASVYRLSFTGFSSQEILEIEEYLAAFVGYVGREALAGTGGGEVYDYQARTNLTELESNLRRMLLYLAHEGVVISGTDGFSVEKAGRADGD